MSIFRNSFDFLSVYFGSDVSFSIWYNPQEISDKMFLKIADKWFHVLFCLSLGLLNVFQKSFFLSSDLFGWVCVESNLFKVVGDLIEENFVSGCVKLSLFSIHWVDVQFSTQAVW